MAALLGTALLLTGCGSGRDVTIVKSSVSASRPSGAYTWESDVHDVVPPGSVKVLTGESGVWTFHDSGCTRTRCTGTITTSHGHEWNYGWDGTRFEISRDPQPLRQGCADRDEQDRGGYAQTRRTYEPTSTTEVAPHRGSGDGPPETITFDVKQHSTTLKLAGCTQPRTVWTALTVHFVLTRGG